MVFGIKCGPAGDAYAHAGQLVGYGEEKGDLYWLVRNSWGTSCMPILGASNPGRTVTWGHSRAQICRSRHAPRLRGRGRGGLHQDQALRRGRRAVRHRHPPRRRLRMQGRAQVDPGLRPVRHSQRFELPDRRLRAGRLSSAARLRCAPVVRRCPSDLLI